jgi:hypothetical protein
MLHFQGDFSISTLDYINQDINYIKIKIYLK